MNKMFRDLMVSFVVFFMYVLFKDPVESPVGALVISVAAAATFSLYSALIRCLVEGYLSMNKNISKEKVAKRIQMSLVFRDTLLAYALIYGFMTSNFGLGLSIPQMSGYLVAALAPTLVVGIVIKEIRVPFLREYTKHDAVARSMGVNKIA
ncbi:hypothetical protein [Intestinibacter bartlettii]|uniref:RDD family protein n=1 Tax=Intestinibacter bartlettii TaxID=261299 RepID=A0ABS6DV76_9FIRM|nr:hypothetical protein [Intestinibacter bartlettii]MBU5335504.1 hypothetical protein [Intestinibacter bartlettii]